MRCICIFMHEKQRMTNTNENKALAASERLTSSAFWDACYVGRQSDAFDERNWKNYVSIQLIRLIESLQLDERNVCEVGGGDAALTCHLARRHRSARFSVIDFSPLGCELARKRAAREGVELHVCQADLFSPPQEMLGHFDLVMSHGVVEHFTDLSSALNAKRRLIHDAGKLFTLIPNFESRIYAALCRRWSLSVFEDHVPHSMKSFLDGHREAGLQPVAAGYLGAIEFGMLSMAMGGPERKTWFDRKFYLWLTRFSKIIHLLEYRTGDLPTTRLLSPFMYAVSVKTA